LKLSFLVLQLISQRFDCMMPIFFLLLSAYFRTMEYILNAFIMLNDYFFFSLFLISFCCITSIRHRVFIIWFDGGIAGQSVMFTLINICCLYKITRILYKQ
jgi:hypothetical protein